MDSSCIKALEYLHREKTRLKKAQAHFCALPAEQQTEDDRRTIVELLAQEHMLSKNINVLESIFKERD